MIMEYTKEDLKKVFDDVRRLVQNGIPIIEISKRKGMFDWLRHNFEQWLKSL